MFSEEKLGKKYWCTNPIIILESLHHVNSSRIPRKKKCTPSLLASDRNQQYSSAQTTPPSVLTRVDGSQQDSQTVNTVGTGPVQAPDDWPSPRDS
jgi:hypothetical protein